MSERASNSIQINGERVKELRLTSFLTQRELAEKAGVRIESISRIENGARTMTYRSTLRALAEALGVEPKELLRDE